MLKEHNVRISVETFSTSSFQKYRSTAAKLSVLFFIKLNFVHSKKKKKNEIKGFYIF